MRSSKYLERFKTLPAEAMQLIGDLVLVERVPVEERRTAGGLIMSAGIGEKARSTIKADLPVFVHVLAVGKGYYDEEGKSTPLNVRVGDVILVGAESVRWFSDMDIPDYQAYEIGLTREQEISLRFEGEEAYKRAFAYLAPRTEAQVPEGAKG